MLHVKETTKKVIGQIYETTDYNHFRLNPYNRRFEPSLLSVLRKSIKEYGQQMPILVTKSGLIVEGHHRLKVCEQESISVYFIESDLTDEQAFELLREINVNQRQWSTKNLIDYYAGRGNENYVKAVSLAKEYGIRPNIIANSLGEKGIGTKDIKEGKLILRDEDLLRKFLEYHKTFSFLPVQKQSYFIQSLFQTWSNPKVNEQRLRKQIIKNKELFELSVKKSVCVKRMKEVYNHNLKKESSKI
ncbi:MAG TPA: ParB N-terminal domain-containing protein [Bacteroidales bacterium]|nr:ParB N-terminal domain-containing protein [Bacteroidales bacterium]